MNISEATNELLRLLKLTAQVARLPVARLRFERAINPAEIAAAYHNFTRPHPRYRLVPNKAMGMALIDLNAFCNRAAYLETVRQKGYATQNARRAAARGYHLAEIDRNAYVNDIHQINTSAKVRQGRPMDEAYHSKKFKYENRSHFKYFGVLNKEGKLVAYCNIAMWGNFATIDQLLGYKSSEGFMYLLLLEIACRLIDEGELRYFMYDTFLGAQPGLRNFKKRFGFQPYRVRYSMS